MGGDRVQWFFRPYRRRFPKQDDLDEKIQIPDYLSWFKWRPIIAGKTTLKEIECFYSYVDLLDLHEAMDIDIQMQILIDRENQKKLKDKQ